MSSQLLTLSRWIRLCLAASVLGGLLIHFSGTANADAQLNQLVIGNQLAALKSALENTPWNKVELGDALIAAAGVNSVVATETLLAAGAPVDHSYLHRTPLIVGIVEDHPEVTLILLKNGADVNFVSTYSWRPLHYAITKQKANSQIIKYLIEFGADIDAKTSLELTPLHRAAGFCQIEAAQILISAGANLKARDKRGLSASERAKSAGCSISQ